MEDLIKALKITYEDIFALHHNLTGDNYFGNHEQLGEYYEMIKDMADEIVENALILGVKEPSIKDALETYDITEIMPRNARESFTIVKDLFNGLIALIEDIKGDTPDYIKNLLEEKQEILSKEANFKIANMLK